MLDKNYIIGFHAVVAALKSGLAVNCCYMLAGKKDKRANNIIDLLKQKNIPFKQITRDQLDKMVGGSEHQGIVLEMVASVKTGDEATLETLVEQLTKPAFLLVLDGVQDPHNLGACLRSANAAGVDAVIIPKDRAVGLTTTVSKVASGAAELTPLIQVTNLSRILTWLKQHGVWIYAAAETGEQSLFSLELSGSIALVLGAEGKGLRQLTAKQADFSYYIPTFGDITSLNVSVATGVSLFEAVRQRQINIKDV